MTDLTLESKIIKDLEVILGGANEEAIDLWLRSPNSHFNDRVPKDMIIEGQGDDVLAYLEGFILLKRG